MATPWSKTYKGENHTFLKFREDDHQWSRWQAQIFDADYSHKCPTYVHRTPPCQGGCPAGEDIRGWLQIVRGIEKPPEEMSWQEYAFRRILSMGNSKNALSVSPRSRPSKRPSDA